MLEIGLQERVIVFDRHAAIGIAIRAEHVGMRQETAAAKAWRRSEASLRLGVTFLQQAHEIVGTTRVKERGFNGAARHEKWAYASNGPEAIKN